MSPWPIRRIQILRPTLWLHELQQQAESGSLCESFCLQSMSGTNEPGAVLELGGSVVLTESTALDVLVGAGLTRSAPDYRITIALPIRF